MSQNWGPLHADRHTLEQRVSRIANVVLRGHEHRADVIRISNASGELVVIPCGSVFDARQSPNAYNMVRMNLETGDGIVYLRRFNSRRIEWQKDTDSTGDENDGQISVRIPKLGSSETLSAFPKDVRRYSCTFTKDCKRSMDVLGLTEDQVLNLVQNEFRSHVNYFRFDLEDYPLPTRDNNIVYLNKVGKGIEFRKVIRSTNNEAQLASWNDLLSLYRQATRLAYREDPHKLIFIRGMAHRATDLHLDLSRRMIKHFERFESLVTEPQSWATLAEFTAEAKVDTSMAQKVEEMTEKLLGSSRNSKRAQSISFHLGEAAKARNEVGDVVSRAKSGFISDDSAMTLMTTSLESSLQHLHKVLLNYPPEGGPD